MNITEYPLPQTSNKSYERWIKCESKDFIPNESQRYIMNLVSESLDQGLFYTRDVFTYVESKMKEILPVDYQREIGEVENGVLGMEVYYARQAVEAIKQQNKANDILNNLKLTEGKDLGTLKFNDGSTFHQVKINNIIDSQNINCTGIRGKKNYEINMSSIAIQSGLNRWKNNRKETY
jgi:hypothetical protein